MAFYLFVILFLNEWSACCCLVVVLFLFLFLFVADDGCLHGPVGSCKALFSSKLFSLSNFLPLPPPPFFFACSFILLGFPHTRTHTQTDLVFHRPNLRKRQRWIGSWGRMEGRQGEGERGRERAFARTFLGVRCHKSPKLFKGEEKKMLFKDQRFLLPRLFKIEVFATQKRCPLIFFLSLPGVFVGILLFFPASLPAPCFFATLLLSVCSLCLFFSSFSSPFLSPNVVPASLSWCVSLFFSI